MIANYRAGKCPFCDPLDDRNEVLCERGGWRIWDNPFPLKNTRRHLIMAPHRHIGPTDAIPQEDLVAVGDLFLWAVRELGIDGGCLAMRFGSPEWNAGSVLHLHVNVIQPSGDGSVQVTLAKEPEKVTEIVARMRVFERLRQGVEASTLSVEEQKLVEGRL